MHAGAWRGGLGMMYLNESESLHQQAHRVVDLGLPGVVEHARIADGYGHHSHAHELHDVCQRLH